MAIPLDEEKTMTKTMAKIFSFGLLVLGLMMVDVKGPTFETKTYNSYTVSSMNWESWSIGVNQADAGCCSGLKKWVKKQVNNVKKVVRTTYAAVSEGTRKFLNNPTCGLLNINTGLGDRVTATVTSLCGDACARANAEYAGYDDWQNAKAADLEHAIMNGEGVYVEIDGQKVYMTTGMTVASGNMEGCMPLPVKIKDVETCIFCPLFKVLYNASEAMATMSYKTLAEAFKILLAIGLALYLAFITLKQVSAFTKQDAPKYISEALTISFKVLLAWLILSKGEELYRLVLQPLLSAGIEFGAAFLTHQEMGTATVDVKSCISSGGLPAASGIVFYSKELYTQIDCFLRAVAKEIAVAQALGSSLMCVATEKAATFIGSFPDLDMLLSGFLMWLFAWLICLAFGFYLIDSVIRLGIVGAIMPFLIAAWPFKATSGYTKKGWDMFLNAFFTFVFIGLVVSVNVELMARAATGGKGSTQEMFDLFNGDDIDKLEEVMSIGGSGLLFMLLCCIFGFKLCAEAASLASDLSGAKSGSIGSQIGSAAAGAAKWGAGAAWKVGKNAALIAGDAITDSEGNSVNEIVRDKAEQGRQAFGKAGAKVLGKMGFSRFSDSASGQLNNKGMAENTGGGQNPNDDPSPDGDNPNPNSNPPQTPKDPQTQSDRPDGNNARTNAEREQAEAAAAAAVAAPVAAALNPENQKDNDRDDNRDTSAASEEAVAKAENAEATHEAEQEVTSTVSNAKNDLSESATQMAEAASDKAADKATSTARERVAAGIVSRMDKADSRRAAEARDEQKKDSKKNDEDQAREAEINRLRTEIYELRELLRTSGVDPMNANSVDVDKLFRLEEELKRLGVSID